jgi:hypothetical protein
MAGESKRPAHIGPERREALTALMRTSRQTVRPATAQRCEDAMAPARSTSRTTESCASLKTRSPPNGRTFSASAWACALGGTTRTDPCGDVGDEVAADPVAAWEARHYGNHEAVVMHALAVVLERLFKSVSSVVHA